MIGFVIGGAVVTVLASVGRGYKVQRAKERTGPNSRAHLKERVVAVRTDTLTNRSVRVGRRSLIHRLLSRLHTA